MNKSYFKFLLLLTATPFVGIAQTATTKGEVLARQYCSMCHKFPAPDLLPKNIWTENILPNMGKRLGIKSITADFSQDQNSKESPQVYPSTPLLSETDWKKIVDYYQTLAPKNIPPQINRPKITKQASFTASSLELEGKPIPQTTMLFANDKRKEIFIGEAKNILYVKDSTNTLYTLPPISSPPVAMINKQDGVFDIACIGSISPTDARNGQIYEMDLNNSTFTVLIDSLARPVDILWANLQNKPSKDLLICEFGNNIGGLTILWDGKIREPLLERPGTRKAQVADLNKDGLLDIVVMYSQGREGISILYNLGNGKFEEKVILEFHPLMGLSYFQLADLDQDGLLDILLTNGDNWDYSQIQKNFHGLRIYKNMGNDIFEEKWFFPQFGAAKSLAYDFDQDGDLDIAAIAFYDDLENNEERFLYFENKGNLDFEAQYLPESRLGKWLTMDIADFNQDGFPDIYLGSYFHNTNELAKYFLTTETAYPQILILKNNMQK